MDTATDILVEAARLDRAAGYGWIPILAMLLLLAAVRVLGPKIRIPGDPESQKPLPDAQWTPPDPDHPGGGMEGG